MELFLFIGILLALFLLGIGIPYALGITSVIVMLFTGTGEISVNSIAMKFASGPNSFILLAIPFFLLAAKLMNTGSITRRIFDFCNALVGWIPGGLGHANILASIVFAGMSGSAVADAAGLGTIEINAMDEQGFDKEFSAGITAASSTIGPIIPPSIPLVVLGTAAGISISKLLFSGLLPGLLMGLTLMIMVFIFAKKRNYPRRPLPSLKEVWELFKASFLSLLTPVILIGGILTGIFTPTEGAAVASLYAFILTVIIYREISIKDFLRILKDIAIETSALLLVVGASALYGYMVVRLQVPTKVLNLVLEITDNKYLFLLLINIFLLFIGCFMETNSAILILAPILMPIAVQYGINPIHFGLLMVLNLQIGLLTPPVGMCLYATSSVAGISVERTLKGTAPFYIPLAVTLILVTYVPWISTLIPSLM